MVSDDVTCTTGHDRSLFKKKLKLLSHFVFECALFFSFLLFCAV